MILPEAGYSIRVRTLEKLYTTQPLKTTQVSLTMTVTKAIFVRRPLAEGTLIFNHKRILIIGINENLGNILSYFTSTISSNNVD